MMTSNRKIMFLVFFSVFVCIFSGCSNFLTSANYWSGVEKEKKYVDRHFKNGFSNESNKKSDGSAFENPAPAFLKNNVEKFRVGIVISGEYWEFADNLRGLVEGFENIGWANKVTVASEYSLCSEIIHWLNNVKYSNYVEFAPEYFVDLEWGDNIEEFEEKYFENVPDVDVIIAYGGMAAKLFYENETYPVPVLADAITDSMTAGVTKTPDDSGRDFFSGRIDLEIFKQQIRMFHRATGFKKLGIIYGDDEYGRIYSAVRDIESVADELGFEIIRNTNVKEEMADDTVSLYLDALKDVCKSADAVYIGASTAVTEYDIIPRIASILAENKIPSFALEGSIRVKNGILYSFSAGSFTRSGIWTATKISHIFSGVKPSALKQRFENFSSMAVNVETAGIIGYKIPIDIIINSDEVYLDWNGTEASDENSGDFSNITSAEFRPKRKQNGEKFRIAVVESGEYWEFAEHFKGIIKGLQSGGWLGKDINVPDQMLTVPEIYDLLGTGYSNYIDFPEDCFINFDWDENPSGNTVNILQNKSVDLVIGLGGIAGKFFSSRKDLKIPVLLEGITDPIGSRVIYSLADSGNDYITCRVDQTQFQRQIQFFHDLIHFKKLGIIYGDTEYGRLYGAVNDIELVALKNDFSVVRETNVREYVSPETPKMYIDALKKLCRNVDAVYIGASTAVTEYDIIPQIAEILKKEKIPSFAQEGEIRVKEGILLGVSSLETEKIGLYNAEKIVSILYGTLPRLLSQDFMGMSSIAVNMNTAKEIDWDFPLSTIAIIDRIY